MVGCRGTGRFLRKRIMGEPPGIPRCLSLQLEGPVVIKGGNPLTWPLFTLDPVDWELV